MKASGFVITIFPHLPNCKRMIVSRNEMNCSGLDRTINKLRLSDNLPRFSPAPRVRMDAAANFPSRSSSRFRCFCASGSVAFALSASPHIRAAISSIARYLAIFPRFVAMRTSVNSRAAFAFPRRWCCVQPLFFWSSPCTGSAIL